MVKFTHKKRHTAPDGPGPGRPRAAPRVEPKRHHTHGGLAAELWANDYKSLFELEASERPEIGQMLESVIDEGASTYRQQRRGGEMAVARHQSGVAAAQLSLAAQVRRLANVRDISLLPSLPLLRRRRRPLGHQIGLAQIGLAQIGSAQIGLAQIGLRYILLVHDCRLSARDTRLSSLIGVGPASAGAAAFMDGG